MTRIIRDGGPWEDPVLQAILKAKPVSQELGTSFITVIFWSSEKCVQLCWFKIYSQVLSAGIAQGFNYFSVGKCAGLFFV